MTHARKNIGKAAGGGFWRLKPLPKVKALHPPLNIPEGYYWDEKSIRKKKPDQTK
jgi:hypothetical protein